MLPRVTCSDDCKMKEFQIKRSLQCFVLELAMYLAPCMRTIKMVVREDDSASKLYKADCKTSLYNVSNLFFFQIRW